MSKPQHICRIFTCLVFAPLSVFLVGLSNAQGTAQTKPQEEKIRSVIQQQLNAFNRDDYDAAYSLASRHIQTEFSRPEFEQMVKNGYPQIARSSRAMFEKIAFLETESRAVATVTITGLDRITITADYRIVWEDGKWRIDGVMIIDQQMPISYEPD
ncbi:MAG TPA: DUF4864 domain-containing protein [Nitrospiria bacterium]|jgi:hypothetical protein|nr:DUF4864 domain-containing protein [Nitrospiria bacterium]